MFKTVTMQNQSGGVLTQNWQADRDYTLVAAQISGSGAFLSTDPTLTAATGTNTTGVLERLFLPTTSGVGVSYSQLGFQVDKGLKLFLCTAAGGGYCVLCLVSPDIVPVG
jgi:hypothetical protein